MEQIDPMPPEPTVCTVVLAYGGTDDDMEACLESLNYQTGVRQTIVVVQNGASEERMEQIETAFPDVHLIREKQNTGIATGRNIGIQWALSHGMDLLFFLDNDATVAPTALHRLVQACSNNADVGFLGCVVYRKFEPDVIYSAGAIMRPPVVDEHLLAIDPGLDTMEVDYVGGGAMMVPVQTIKRVGCFDDLFFLGDEDVELCLRGKQAGLKTMVVNSASAYHDVPKGLFNPRHVYYRKRNRIVVARRYGYMSSVFDRRFVAWVFNTCRRMLLSTDVIALNCTLAYSTAVFHAIRGRMGKCPAYFDRPVDSFLEARLWRKLQKTALWAYTRRLKRFVSFSKKRT